MGAKKGCADMAKKILIGVGAVLGIVVLAAVGLIGWLTVTEYKPDAVEHVEVEVPDGPHAPFPAPGDSVTILSQNTGYAGLGKDSDFFMDGGGDVAPTKEHRPTRAALPPSWSSMARTYTSSRRWTPTPGAPTAWIRASFIGRLPSAPGPVSLPTR